MKLGIHGARGRLGLLIQEEAGQAFAGAIVPIDVPETLEEVADALLIGTADEIIDKLGIYEELRVQDLLLNMSFGASHGDVLASMERFARDVMPATLTRRAAA